MINLEKAIEKIEKARLAYDKKHIVKIVAASKYVDSEAIKELYGEGQRAFGENKAQDMKEKSSQLSDLPIEWHYLGRIQTNKINMILDINPYLIHSINDYETAIEIDKRAKAKNIKINGLLQINSAKEESKAGVFPEVGCEEYIKITENLSNINLKGVMTIGAHTDDFKTINDSFATTRRLFEALKNYNPTICSMGMSSDYELAIANGSTMVRIGSAIFK